MVATHPLTAADVVRLGLAGERMELIDGELREKEPMGARLGETEIRLTLPLGFHLLGQGLGEIYPSDTQFKILRDPDIIQIPDLAFVRADRLPPKHERIGILNLAPDLAVEIVSPNDRRPRIMEKIERYQRAGVPLIWLVDPHPRTVEVHALGEPMRLLREFETLDGGEVIPGFRLLVADIFA